MARTSSSSVSPVTQPSAGLAGALPYWNPYVAGFALGLVLLVTFMVTGRGLGASSGFAAVATWFASLGSVAHVEANAVHARYWNGGAPLQSWTLLLLIGAALGAILSAWQGRRLSFHVERGPRVSDGTRLLLAFVGGVIVAFGSKIAKGCTSGQALSGGSMLNVGSLVFMLSVFASAYALAYLVRKQWL